MNIHFALQWMTPAQTSSKAFKLPGALSLYQDYCRRLSYYAFIKTGVYEGTKASSSQIWMCDLGPKAQMISSDKLAQKLQQTLETTKNLFVMVGGANGFSEKDYQIYKPQFIWSFGPLTLPHELAAVVAAEQIYRAWTILKGLPYHKGHL